MPQYPYPCEHVIDAIHFPLTGIPKLVKLNMTTPSPVSYNNPAGPYGDLTNFVEIPHPEIHMEYIARNLGSSAWKYQLVESLDGMNKKLSSPYIVFYPVVSRDDMAFPINGHIRLLQGRTFKEDMAWRGDIVVAKYTGHSFNLVNTTMADYPIVKNYFMTYSAPPEFYNY